MTGQTNKRNFLKALALAPVAAASVTRSLASTMANYGALNAASFGGSINHGGQIGISIDDDPEHLHSQIKWAQKYLSELRSNDNYRRSAHIPLTLRAVTQADQLRSVSPAIRMLIAEREADRLVMESEIAWHERAIAVAKKKLGILGFLLD